MLMIVQWAAEPSDPSAAQTPGPQAAQQAAGSRLGPARPQHAVEQQLAGVVRGEPLELQVGPVQHYLAQPADLGIDVKHCSPVHRGWY